MLGGEVRRICIGDAVMAKPVVLVTGPMMKLIEEQLDRAFEVHRGSFRQPDAPPPEARAEVGGSAEDAVERGDLRLDVQRVRGEPLTTPALLRHFVKENERVDRAGKPDEEVALQQRLRQVERGYPVFDRPVELLSQLPTFFDWEADHPYEDPSLLERLEGLTALLAQLDDLRKLADHLGRLEESTRRKGPQEGGREEVVGVRLGGDFANALPSELGLLGDPDTEDLFYQRFLERRLVTLELEGAGDEGVAMGDKRGPGPIRCATPSPDARGQWPGRGPAEPAHPPAWGVSRSRPHSSYEASQRSTAGPGGPVDRH